jgi:hypothetical protein
MNNEPITKLKNGMTKESLIFVIECILDGCCEKLQDLMPDAINISERQRLTTTGVSTDIAPFEAGLIAQALGSVSIIVAQSIDDGIGDGDADDLLGDFSGACEKFIASNWKGYGQACKARFDRVAFKSGFNYRDIYLDYPDTLAMARRIVTDLNID